MHRKKSRMALALVAAGIASFPATRVAHAVEHSCDALVAGPWAWFVGGTVTFASTGTARYSGNGTLPAATAKWSCIDSAGTAQINWVNGFVDTVKLSADGRALSGRSSTGSRISAARNGAAMTPPAAPAVSSQPAAAPKAKTPAEGWTPIGTGGMGRQSNVPIGPNGPVRIGPQGRPPPK